MDESLLKRANDLRNRIDYVQRDINDIDKIVAESESMGSSIEFRRNDTGWSRSFGSKKYGFKTELVTALLTEVRERLVAELEELKTEFKNL